MSNNFSAAMSAARDYLAFPDLEAPLRQELAALLDAAHEGDAEAALEIADRFSAPLGFGTGGLRGLMGAGLRRMNKPNVRRVTLALAQVARDHCAVISKALVGYDTRVQSDEFALEAARVLAAAGFTVYLGTKPLPTPFLAFAMRKLGTACGIIVTASHNPSAYNGYKAYNNLGAQVVAPWDREVEAAMRALPLVPCQLSPDIDASIMSIPASVEEEYCQLCLDVLARPANLVAAKVLYTPLHGTGMAFVPELFKRAGLPLDICVAQAIPDGSFPTAPRPNPEEASTFKTPLEDAQRLGSEVILANDPDADRLGLMYKHQGEWVLMSGNDMAALTLDYMATELHARGAVITTVVTSDFLATVARFHGLPVVWTLTGFKNIAACMQRLSERSEAFVFAAEESVGMCPLGSVRDKDGISSALLLAEMAGYYKAKGQTLGGAVEALQSRVGVFHNRLISLEDASSEGAERFAAIMELLRRSNMRTLAGEVIEGREDYLTGMRYTLDGQASPLLDRPDRPDIGRCIEASNVIKFRFANGGFAAFRASGTEPKFKIYLQSRITKSSLDRMEHEIRRLIDLH